ncbi:MAG: tetratricopeptide repeat protein [Myxococcales bacterium]|nr:tetratricopeptide repeat protein [Myxococcales bacterium]MCB9731416.1 tetratricopeptide repeat protein [Deltaproteobacteria bacterium]
MADEGDMRARLELADLHERSGDTKSAVRQFIDIARRYERDGFGLKAFGVYLHAARLDPKAREAQVALGRLYTEHGLFEEAATRYDLAVRAVGADGTAGRKAALEVVSSLLERDSENLADRLRLAEAHSGFGQHADAVRELRRVADVLDQGAAETDYQVVAERLLYHKPDDIAVARTLATSYVAREEPQRALAKLKTAFEAAPKDLEVLGLLAETFNQLGQVHKAVAVLKEMARIYDKNGFVHERDECFTKILMLDPNDRSARESLGESGTEAEGQTLEFYPQLVRQRAPGAVAKGRPTVANAAAAADDADDFDDDFEFDFDDDEIGFGGGAENTIVDDAFIPDEVRGELEPAGIVLNVPGTAGDQVVTSRLEEELRELDFYVNNGLVDEGRALLAELITRHGRHPLIERREKQLDEQDAQREGPREG